MIVPYGAALSAMLLWTTAASPLAPEEPDILPTRTVTRHHSRTSDRSGGCTTTISRHVTNPCAWDGTQTIYASTTTQSASVDCGGCSHIYQVMEIYNCPEQRILTTTRARTPSTSWTTVCASSTSRRHPHVPTITPPPCLTAASAGEEDVQSQELDRRQDAILTNHAEEACPTTFIVQPAQTAGATLTRYRQTITQTVLLNCGGCQLHISTALAGYGPAGKFTTTVTAQQSQTTVYRCR